jgi:DNA sulfur modification protein DndD
MPFLKASVDSARARLAALKSEGAIPSDYLPLLQERLEVGRCVCGTELVPGSPHREAIEKLLKDQQSTSAIKDRLTALYYVTSTAQPESGLAVQLGRLETRLVRSQTQHAAAGARIRAVELQISQLGDVDIEALQASYKDNEMALRKTSEERVVATETVKSLRRQLDEVTKIRDRLLESEKDAKAIQAKLLVANDIRQVISHAKERIQDEKLKEVSSEMDLLFRRMIGSDAEVALIKSAQITSDFDVVVFSQTGARLDPDLQLNGAARRAITLAFILAIAKVSGFRSPNVIDTPLGMMGIEVKQAALATLVQESAQPILFLTHAEIRDIEDALDRYAGSKVTLTMTAHYPTYLRNKPPVEGPEILRCECGHREQCELCERVFTSADIAEAVA